MPEPIINTIKDLVEHSDIELKEDTILPICHTSRWDILINDIIPNGNKLRPTEENDYGEELLFFFYGKAKYIPENDVKNIYEVYDPFTLVFNLKDNVREIHRLVVFDSGGFPKYKIGIRREHFELIDCDENILKKLVTIFFGNNDNYLDGKMSPVLNPSDFPFCGAFKEYCILGENVNKTQKPTEYGEQAITFEIQFKEFKLDESLVAAVIPDIAFSSEASKKQCRTVFGDIKFEPYTTDTQIKSYINMSDKVKEKIKQM